MHNNYTQDKYALRKEQVKYGSVYHLSASCKYVNAFMHVHTVNPDHVVSHSTNMPFMKS